MIYGVVTDQCVRSAVRDAADRGYLVTQVEDCCATYSAARHDQSIRAMAGHYARCRSADQVIAEMAG
ncbi:MAG: isochorismatase family protein [Alphaproteobacteria bacterium]